MQKLTEEPVVVNEKSQRTMGFESMNKLVDFRVGGDCTGAFIGFDIDSVVGEGVVLSITHPFATGSKPARRGVHLKIPSEYMELQHPLVHWELDEQGDQLPNLSLAKE